MEMALKSHKLISASFQLLFCSFPTSQPSKNQRVRTLLWIRLWLKEMLWLISFSIQTTQTFLQIISKFVSLSYYSCVQQSSTFNFFQESFLCFHNLANWLAKEAQGLACLSFDMPSSPCLIISSFWFQVRDLQLFLSLGHLETIVGFLIGLISISLCLRGRGGPRRQRR